MDVYIVKEYQCVCHIFCQEVGLNSWKVVFVLVPDLEVGFMNELVTLFIINVLFYTHAGTENVL